MFPREAAMHDVSTSDRWALEVPTWRVSGHNWCGRRGTSGQRSCGAPAALSISGREAPDCRGDLCTERVRGSYCSPARRECEPGFHVAATVSAWNACG